MFRATSYEKYYLCLRPICTYSREIIIALQIKFIHNKHDHIRCVDLTRELTYYLSLRGRVLLGNDQVALGENKIFGG